MLAEVSVTPFSWFSPVVWLSLINEHKGSIAQSSVVQVAKMGPVGLARAGTNKESSQEGVKKERGERGKGTYCSNINSILVGQSIPESIACYNDEGIPGKQLPPAHIRVTGHEPASAHSEIL